MARTATTSLSARSTALASSAIITVGLAASVWTCFSGAASAPAMLVISTAHVAVDPDDDVVAFELGAAERSADYLLIIGSLGDAGQVSEIQLASHAVTHQADAISLNSTPGKAIGITRSVENLAANSVQKLQDAAESSSIPVTQRLFFLQLGSDAYSEASYQAVEVRLSIRLPRITVWEDIADRRDGITENASWIANCLEQVVLPKLAGLYGDITDLDGDGTFAVCLTRRLAGLPSAGVPVEGLVQFNDFQPDLSRPFGNQADVMFVSADLSPGPHATSILAHEAAHLAVFSRRREADAQHPQPEDDWLNEGLAHYAETRCGGDRSNLATRIAAFESRPGLAALVVPDAVQQGLWRDPGARGAAWAFVSWLAQAYGDDILLRIAGEAGVGCEKIGRITRQPFEELFRQWTMARWSADDAQPPENHGFDRPAKKTPYFDSASLTIALRGSGHVGYRVRVDRGQRLCFRVAAAKHAKLQVTVVEGNGTSPRFWPVR